jgi:hypothetical protein
MYIYTIHSLKGIPVKLNFSLLQCDLLFVIYDGKLRLELVSLLTLFIEFFQHFSGIPEISPATCDGAL